MIRLLQSGITHWRFQQVAPGWWLSMFTSFGPRRSFGSLLFLRYSQTHTYSPQENTVILRYRRQHSLNPKEKRFPKGYKIYKDFFPDHHENPCTLLCKTARGLLAHFQPCPGVHRCIRNDSLNKTCALEGHIYVPRDSKDSGLSTLAAQQNHLGSFEKLPMPGHYPRSIR